MDGKIITERECDVKHENLNAWINKIEARMEKIESKFWWVITLLISNLTGIIVLLIRGG